jgi:uncharacterized protein YjbJ (UPF0337 family)
MGTLKATADKAAGTAKEIVAEIVGDAALQEEGKRQRRKAAVENDEKENLLGNLDKLT